MSPVMPFATYRLQLTEAFGFQAAADLVPYLRRLGISHVYASPILRARSGSTHGYDVVDPDKLDPRLGGEEGFAQLRAALDAAQMGLILDFVPNHMGIGKADNAWWLDVLEWGLTSPYARFFDIDWLRMPGRQRPGIVLPILGKPYGEALRDREIALKFDPAAGSFSFWYFEHRLPVRPQDYGAVLRLLSVGKDVGKIGVTLLDLVGRCPPRRMDHAAGGTLKASLSNLTGAGDFLNSRLEAWQKKADLEALHRLLLRQHYRPTFWRNGTADINYRRFFDINDLAGLRIEDAAVFDAVHRLVLDLLREGKLQGLRIDHIDGLQDPIEYCRRLGEQSTRARGGSKPYIIVEKILGEGEALPPFPAVAGTTGYEWMSVFARLFLQEAGLSQLEWTWRSFTGETRAIADLIHAAKTEVLDGLFSAEFASLSRLLRRIATGHCHSQDFSLAQLETALRAYILRLPVYRTYIASSRETGEQDRAIIDRAMAEIRDHSENIEAAVFDFLHQVLTGDILEDRGYSRRRVDSFVAKLQQLTGPVMAKAVEDTSFYRVLRLLALNEVGGHPDAEGMSAADFHEAQRKRMVHQPSGLTATATHDTKRGEDARMRLVALSELAEEWDAAIPEWSRMNERHIQDLAGRRAPSREHEYLLYQALLGGWPNEGPDDDFAARFAAYALKAARESKRQTSWRDPDQAYEEALQNFARAVVQRERAGEFLVAFAPFAARAALLGALNSLSQLALKILLPGIPDVYQGTEYWDLSFVDPDNRRPVDYAMRRQQQQETWPSAETLAAQWPDGQIKFVLLRRLLALRAANPDLFREGSYEPLSIDGPHADSVVAFCRRLAGRSAVVIVGRKMASLADHGRNWPSAGSWGYTAVDLPDGEFEDLLGASGRYLGLAELQTLMWPWPVAVLGQNVGF